MPDVMKALIENDYILFTMISLVFITVIAVVIMFLVAFYQGRSIGFWPPKIGEKRKETVVKSSDKKIGEKKKEIVVKSSDKKSVANAFYVNREVYYEKYYSLVTNAKKSVYMVGDGFACHELGNSEYAYGLINSIRAALEKGVLVKRFQYHTTLSLTWLRMLCDLKEEFEDRFQIYMNEKYDPVALPYVICLVDDGKEDASVNVMFTRSSDTSLEEKLAGPAFIFSGGEEIQRLMELMRMSVSDFFQGHFNVSCSDLLNLYDQLKSDRTTKATSYWLGQKEIDVDETSVRKIAKELEILDVELVLGTAMKEISNREKLYFAYGSNIEKGRIRKRCPSARVISRGELKDYKLIFNMIGNTAEGKGGGIANIEKSQGDSVYGVLYRIDKNEMEELNSLEVSMNYEVENLEIIVSESVRAPSTVYICKSALSETHVPTKAYKEFILNGMEMHKFPSDYQSYVKRIMET